MATANEANAQNYNALREKKIMAALAELGGQQITDQSGIRTHGDPWIATPENMTPEALAKIAVQNAKSQSQEHAFSRTFKYRPWDGAHALQSALMKHFGTAGVGQAIQTFFGTQPPRYVTIDVGVGKQTQVPWGDVAFPLFEGVMSLGGVNDREFGSLFALSITCPKKYAPQVEGLFKLVAAELEEFSIYKGKVFNGAEMPNFIDPYVIKREEVVYSDEVTDQLEANVWANIRYTDTMVKNKVPLKRSVLLAGPYGTGKSLAAMLTAQEASENNWTFIQCRPKDDLKQVMSTALLYQPAVVFFEDVDTIAETGDPEAVSTLLDMFDGITIKGTKLLVVLTTNHAEKIHKGMLRPGRLDALIEINALDPSGYNKLIQASIRPEKLSKDIDWDAVSAELTDFLPAFVKEVATRAMRYAVARNKGDDKGQLVTADFVHAARGLRPQLDIMNDAREGTLPDSLETQFRRVVAGTVAKMDIVREGDNYFGKMVERQDEFTGK